MTTTVFRRRRAERFAQLLDEAAGIRRHHVRSRLDDDLAPLITFGNRISLFTTAPETSLCTTLDPEFRDGLRAMLVATAIREGIGRTATAPEYEQQRGVLGRPAVDVRPTAGTRRRPASTARRARARGAVIIGVAAGTLALSGISAASGDAMPGDPLYGVKRSTERAQLALASSDVSRGQLFLEFAKTRVAEAHAVRQDGTGLGRVLTDMDSETRQGVRLLATAAVDRRDPAALDAIDRFIESQRHTVVRLLDQAGPASRDRVLESLTLLDAVTQRTGALRTSLSCGDSNGGSDVLGPKPSTCFSQRAPRTGTGQDSGQAEPTRTERGAPSGAPTGPNAAVPTAVPDPDGQTGQTPPDDGGLLGDLGRILGGILGP